MQLRSLLLALAALALPASAGGQSAAPFDLRNAPSVAGSWSYRTTAIGSEAAFMDAGTVRRMVIACTMSTRTVTISMTSTFTAPMLNIWTSDTARALPARFDAKTFQLSADLSARDPLLDSVAFSRGRIAVSISGAGPLVVPAWAEAARVVEDCRG